MVAAAGAAGCGGGEHGRVGARAACLPPDATVPAHVDPAELGGDFELTLHVEAGIDRDSVVRAHLHLEPWTDGGGDVPRELPWIVEGRTTLTVSPPDATDAAADTAEAEADATAPPARVSSTGGSRRDVVGFWDPHGRSIALVQGAVEDGGIRRAERGVDLRVLRTDSAGFRGTWSTAFWGPPRPSGWFCARRAPGR